MHEVKCSVFGQGHLFLAAAESEVEISVTEFKGLEGKQVCNNIFMVYQDNLDISFTYERDMIKVSHPLWMLTFIQGDYHNAATPGSEF